MRKALLAAVLLGSTPYALALDATAVSAGSGEPISGAYVVVTYREKGDYEAAFLQGDSLSLACRKARGAYTDSAGRVSIPDESGDGLMPYMAMAIKRGFYAGLSVVFRPSQTFKGRFELASRTPRGTQIPHENRMAHDYAYQFLSESHLDCWLAASREDAVPVIPFLEALRDDFVAYYDAAHAREHSDSIAHIEHLIRSLPTREEGGGGRVPPATARDGGEPEFSGRVLDAATKRPIEGALVAAIYGEVKTGLAASAIWCRSVKSLTTGPDGRFRFPVTRRDNLNPMRPRVLVPGYYVKHERYLRGDVRSRRDATAYRGRDIYLAKQPADNPQRRFAGFRDCVDQIESPEERALLGDFEARVDRERARLFERNLR